MSADLHHLAAAYALDALDAEERAAFEAHYPTCEICNADVRDYRETAARLAVESVAPPESVRDQVLAEIAQTRQLPPGIPARVVDMVSRRRRFGRTTLGLVAAASVLVVAGLVGFRLGTSSSDEGIDAVYAADDLAIDTLHGEFDGMVTVAWSSALGELVVAGSNLDEPPPGLVYALWKLDDAGATASVLFEPDDRGRAQSHGPLLGEPTGWGVTLEPVGGSAAPTGGIMYSVAF